VSKLITPGTIARPGRVDSLDDPPPVGYPFLVDGGAYDDEFNTGAALDPKWTKNGTTFAFSANAIDPYWTGTGETREDHNVRRPSWYLLQVPPGAADIRQGGVNFPVACFLWARISFTHRYNGVVNNDSTCQIGMYADLAGAPDPQNRAYVMLNEGETNIIQAQAGIINAGVDASNVTGNTGPQSVGTDSKLQDFCYVGIQRRTLSYDFWVGMPNSHWVRFTPRSSSGWTPSWIVFAVGNSTSAAPGNMILGIDFIRLRSERHLP
jgi:hypothetical protein